MFSAAAYHCAAAVASAKANREFKYRRKYDHAFRLVQQVLRNVIGDIQDFCQHGACIFQAICFFFLRGQRWESGECK